MDVPLKTEQWNTAPEVREAAAERITLFHRLIVTLFALIAMNILLMLWVLGAPDSHQENAAAAGPAATWPDGSAKTSHDWWANAATAHPRKQVAQPPAATPAQPQPSNRG